MVQGVVREGSVGMHWVPPREHLRGGSMVQGVVREGSVGIHWVPPREHLRGGNMVQEVGREGSVGILCKDVDHSSNERY